MAHDLLADTGLLIAADVVLSINETYAADIPSETAMVLLNDNSHQVVLETGSKSVVVLVLLRHAFYYNAFIRSVLVLLILVIFAIFIFSRNLKFIVNPFTILSTK